ncbi:penicillin-binding protein 2 [Sulfurospirillum sp. T05]|uniref:Penicillin-binding protein 2 n=1 Tax=Sulfurospirillum tamanense TaxID=2813362 RepID=A0ABS2WTB4_9BACT|nr:penicillin-binding protein 2 [Sulfurospirillum tamanensis]MBN2964835.1 penicillin-binding protein 2 [Sulfurospirillum tamanensis]
MNRPSLDRKKAKILLLFSLISLGFIIFIGTLLYWSQIDRKLPRLQTSQTSTALRGTITSRDGFVVATSQKLYKAMVDTRNIDPSKQALFINLFSLYADLDPKEIAKRLNSGRGNVVLSYQIDAKKAEYLQELAGKLYRQGVFRTYEDPETGLAFLRGLSISESGEYRHYPQSDIFTPFLGYIRKIDQGPITKVEGVKGIEGQHEQYLKPIQDALLIAPRDIGNTLILNRDSEAKKRIDGYGMRIGVSLKLQKMIERILDEKKEELRAEEVVAAVMKSDTGELLVLASSNRYNPNGIRREDYASLNASAVEYAFEPGSVMKTVMFSLLLKEEKINPFDLVRTYGGKYKLGQHTIRDTKESEWLSAEDVIVYSSNVGSVQLAQKLDAIPYYQGLKDFGFTERTGVDLPYENPGNMPPLQRFNSEVYKGTIGYGYGMQVNFMQILKAYNVFNNNGKMLTPRLGLEFQDASGKTYPIMRPPEVEVLPIAVAKRVKRVLVKAVRQGTGKVVSMEGLEIGGKTGTAHIAEGGRYENRYNGSFFGFANDAQSQYTIGVLVREPKKPYHYFGSLSAAPIFRAIVQKMVDEQYLIPSLSTQEGS